MKLTPYEKKRIAEIRKNTQYFEKQDPGTTRTWEAVFFLKIIDRFLNAVKTEKAIQRGLADLKAGRVHPAKERFSNHLNKKRKRNEKMS